RAAGPGADAAARRFPAVDREIGRVEAALFGPGGATPDLAALLGAIEAADAALVRPDRREGALPPLYPASA
ncbi:hypothetical protein N8I71_18240, partial [Roseibacterium sp. SDUM158016]|uniref:hypothetical protein n=1 Tax=Roseicyclus sediminis TaxID=2980997 RepID=UPI0021CF42BF